MKNEGHSIETIAYTKGTWQEVVDDCRSTVGKPPLGKAPSEQFKRSILIAEHSPIRNISIKWQWFGIPSWIATHWSRHKWECYIKSQRTDRTGINRDKLPQDAPVNFTGEANCQHLIDTMRKRLCKQASHETREYAKSLKETIASIQPELADVLVPNCVYRGGCPEMQPCGWYAHMLKVTEGKIASTDIAERYAAYNKLFEGRPKTEEK